MDHLSLSPDGLATADFDSDSRFQYVSPATWPLPDEHHSSPAGGEPSSAAPSTTSAPMRSMQFYLHRSAQDSRSVMPPPEWQPYTMPQNSPQQPWDQLQLNEHYGDSYNTGLQPSQVGFVPNSQAPLDATMTIDSSGDAPFIPYSTAAETFNPLACYQNDLQNGLSGYLAHQHRMAQPFGQPGLLSSSPPENVLDNHSSASSDNGWQMVDPNPSPSRTSFESYGSVTNNPCISNPDTTLHIRTPSNNTSQVDTSPSSGSLHSFEDVAYPMPSPQSEATLDFSAHHGVVHHGLPVYQYHHSHHQHHSSHDLGRVQTSPELPYSSTDESTSPISPNSGSPDKRKKILSSKPLKQPVTVKKIAAYKKPDSTNSSVEKRVGRRKGPLKPDQRKQASEIRKLRACLRCKFLKKTCDKGDPCAGCQPSHARLWQVPCTRIDIKDIGYFLKDWNVDYERHVKLGFSVANIQKYGTEERSLWITHGYGFVLPVQAREVFVRDEDVFDVDWVESIHDTPRDFDVTTARLATGNEGVSVDMLNQYLDRHIDGAFESFVDEHFEGTQFLSEMLKTAYRFWQRTRIPVIRKALKLVLAYNLTLHVTFVEGLKEDDPIEGRIDDEDSKVYGKILAPVMINFHIKTNLAMMWRDLQKDVLEELSSLYSSVYSGDKLKNWPTIFIVATILLAVWEEMQFDAHYRSPDPANVEKFCREMESTPVGVIVGLFSAISQKVPQFSEWNTAEHGHLFPSSNSAICDTLTEVREHVLKHEEYLRSRNDAKFDRNDFDCLSNKFLSKLVIRA